jgi:hypothetical protein
MAVKPRQLDYTNVKDRGEFNRKHRPEGDYLGKVTAVKTVKKKKEPHDEQWVFTIQVDTGTYPYYCGFGDSELWKVRNLLMACGINVPKKRVNTDPNKAVNKAIGVTLEDNEYNDRVSSQVAAVFAASDLDAVSGEADDEEDEDEDDEAETDDDTDTEEDDDEEDEEPEPEPVVRKKKKAKPAPVEEDDDLDELDIEDV